MRVLASPSQGSHQVRETSAQLGVSRRWQCRRRNAAEALKVKACWRFGARVLAAEVQEEKEEEAEGVEGVEDLLQFEDRAQWYESKWAAVDQPEWNEAKFVRSDQITADQRMVVLEVEVSREKIYLLNAYIIIGQKARVRVVGGLEYEVAVCTPPFSRETNEEALDRLRGDLVAGEVKTGEVEELSIKAELGLFVYEEEAPELYNLEDDDPVELGPFQGGGLMLRGPIAGIYRYPTVVIFCEGAGIATAKSLIEAHVDSANLQLKNRSDVRMYYKAPNDAGFAFRDKFEEWEELGCKVITSTESFQDAFDDDDTLVYEPGETAAIILTGGDGDSEKGALSVCKEAEIGEIVRQSQEGIPSEFLATGVDQI